MICLVLLLSYLAIVMGKSKAKKISTKPLADDHHGNPFEDKDEIETNPFLKKPTKSMKKAAKDQNKRDKKEQRVKEKERKSHAKEEKASDKNKYLSKQPMVAKAEPLEPNEYLNNKETASTQSSLTLPSTRTSENSQENEERVAYQTIDSRSHIENPCESPLLPNKRVLQLKSGRAPAPQSKALHAPLSDQFKRPLFQYSPSQTKSGSDMTQVSTCKSKPSFLDVNPSAASSGHTLSPVSECRTPSPLVAPPADDSKMYRKNSVSKKNKDRKKKKKLKMMVKKKKKKDGKRDELLNAVSSQVVMRRPPEDRLKMLQNEVDETKQVLRKSAVELIEKRQSQLTQMMENAEKLEEIAHGFAVASKENRLKQQARVRCCGIGSRWKFCWYICACEKGVKRRKKREGQTAKNNTEPKMHELLSPRAAVDLKDDDQPYGAPLVSQQPHGVQPLCPSLNLANTSVVVSPRPASGTYLLKDDNAVSETCSLRSKLGNISQTHRGSMPSLLRESPFGSLRNMAALDPRDRKSSSVNALHEIVKKRGAKKREEQERKVKLEKEKRIERFVKENWIDMDEENKKRAASLLRID